MIVDPVFVRSCSYNYILRASTVRRLNTEDWATSANLSTRNFNQAKNLRGYAVRAWRQYGTVIEAILYEHTGNTVQA